MNCQFISASFGSRRVQRPIACVLIGLLTIGLVAGCQREDRSRGDGIGPWKEEVKLSDGRIIVVERFEDFKVRRLLGEQQSAQIKYASIRIVEPKELAGIPELVIRYRPIVLDYDTNIGTWYAIGTDEYSCTPSREKIDKGYLSKNLRSSLHPNFEYRLIDGVWKGVEIGPERVGTPANLLIERTKIDLYPVTPLAVKESLDGDPAIPKRYKLVEPKIFCR